MSVERFFFVGTTVGDGKRLYEQTRTSRYTFGRNEGLVTSMEMTGVIVREDEVEIPLTVSARLLNIVEVAELESRRGTQSAARPSTPAARALPAPAATGELGGLLAQVRSGQDLSAASQRLAQMAVDEAQQAEVAAALGQALESPAGKPARQHIVKALGVWGTSKEVPLLAKVAQDQQDGFAQRAAMEALGRIGTPEAAAAIARTFHVKLARSAAITALERIGAPAEPHVIPLLQDTDADVRADASRILGTIGTSASEKPLEELVARESPGRVKIQAERSLQTIRKRQ